MQIKNVKLNKSKTPHLPIIAFFLSVSASFSTTFWVWAVTIRRVFSASLHTHTHAHKHTHTQQKYTNKFLHIFSFLCGLNWTKWAGNRECWTCNKTSEQRLTHSHEFKVPSDRLRDLWLGDPDCLHQGVETVQRRRERNKMGLCSQSKSHIIDDCLSGLVRVLFSWNGVILLKSRLGKVHTEATTVYSIWILFDTLSKIKCLNTCIVSPGAIALRSFCKAVFRFSSIMSARQKQQQLLFEYTTSCASHFRNFMQHNLFSL